MKNFKKVEHEHQNFLSVIPVYSVVGNFGEDKTDVLIESEVYDDTLDFFNAIYCNSFPF